MSNNELVKKLNQLKDTEAGGKPSKSWVLSNKAILMNQVRPQQTEQFRQEKKNEFVYFAQFLNEQFRFKVLRPAMAMLLIISMMLGYTATVSVANASLPGDTLYPIKTVTEKVQLALTFSDDKKVQLQMGFVSRRVGELKELVQKEEDSQTKAEKVSTTVKKITEDVKSVQEKLTKLNTTDTIQIVKDVDTKTLETSQALVEAHKVLPEDVKEEISGDLKEAIETTNDAGNSALGVIVQKYEEGDEQISDDEVATRVAERIKTVEDDIQGVTEEIELIVSTTASSTELLAAATTTVEIINTELTSSSTIEVISGQKDQAQDVIEEAKDLLDQKDFSSALAKIQEGKEIVDEAVEGTEAEKQNLKEITEDIIEIVETDNTTTTDMIIEVISTSTPVSESDPEETSETTDSILTQ